MSTMPPLATIGRTRGTSAVWLLLSGKACTLSALGRFDDAHTAIDQAADLREHVQPDELESSSTVDTSDSATSAKTI